MRMPRHPHFSLFMLNLSGHRLLNHGGISIRKSITRNRGNGECSVFNIDSSYQVCALFKVNILTVTRQVNAEIIRVNREACVISSRRTVHLCHNYNRHILIFVNLVLNGQLNFDHIILCIELELCYLRGHILVIVATLGRLRKHLSTRGKCNCNGVLRERMKLCGCVDYGR